MNGGVLMKTSTEGIRNKSISLKKPPAYLGKEYLYPPVGENVNESNLISDANAVFEIKCPSCKMSIRAQGQKIKAIYERLIKNGGCFGCGEKELKIYKVDMSKKVD